MFGMMVNTWLTGSGRFGLRRRALTRGSVISERLDISIGSKVDGSGDCRELGAVFFILELHASLKSQSHCAIQD